MPLIRISRDKRGLDTLYLLHQRRDGRGEPRLRVLYFCAMPQGLQFGRPPLDADTQRLLERRYPDVEFDWPALEREVEQRRLPPPMADLHVRRPRPAKAERRPAASDLAVAPPPERSPEKGAGKRRRRRGGGQPADSALPSGEPSTMPGDVVTQSSASGAAPIIE